MNFEQTCVDGAYIVTLDELTDDRGTFARTYCERVFAEHGLEHRMVQANVSHNRVAGTLRGLHFQVHPSPEAKLVRCTRGAILDVAVDLRPSSPTYLRHVTAELSAGNRTALYVPPLCAHGFLTLDDDSEVSYLVSGFYDPSSERGVRYDDPAFGIAWPRPIRVVSPKDASWQDYVPVAI